MKLLKGLAGSLLWILAGVLGLVSILLCVTIILLPLGSPLLGVSRRLMTTGVQLMLPKAVAHPVRESKRGLRGRRDEVKDTASDAADSTAKKGKKGKESAEALTGKVGKKAKKTRKSLRKRIA